MTDDLHIRAVAGCVLMLAVAGCGATTPTIMSGADPADARAGGSSVPYTPVTAGTVDHQPVEPKAWRDMNERVAPRVGRSP